MNYAIQVENITKKYKMYETSKERLYDLLSPKDYGKNFYALKNVSFKAEKGDVIGFIGINGSGKSTLSNIISGIVPESSGKVIINGQVSLIAVAAGLKNDLTGRENIELKLLMLGFSKKEINELEEDIIEFSELGEFIDQPVKSYSSGMKSRLGFSISVNIDPDILVIDEALSVGDKAFAEKSFNKMNEFKEVGKTMIFVSHSLGQMRQFCNKILWLEFGQVKEFGPVNEVMTKYEDFLNIWQKLSADQREEYKQESLLNNAKVNTKKYIKEQSNTKIKKVSPVSLLAHFKAAKSSIYMKEKMVNSEPYKDKVYYVKLKAIRGNLTYYLLSQERSSTTGVIGWVEARKLNVFNHIEVESLNKTARLNGMGKGLSEPWGGKRQIIHSDLNKYVNQVVSVIQIDLVGSNVWYKVILDKEYIWVHETSLKNIDEGSSLRYLEDGEI